MADRHLAPEPDRAGVPSAADAPLVDLIFPNRDQSRAHGYDPSGGYRAQDTGSMPRHRDPGSGPRHDASPPPRHDTGSVPRYDTGSIPRYDTGSTPRHESGPAPRHDTGSIPRYDAGSTPRYDTGSTPRHDTGSTPRYDTGSTPRYDTGSTPRYDTGSVPRYDAGPAPRPDSRPAPRHDTGSMPRYDTGSIPRFDSTGSMPRVDSTGSMPRFDSTGSMPRFDSTGSMPRVIGQPTDQPGGMATSPMEPLDSPRFTPTAFAPDPGGPPNDGGTSKGNGLTRLFDRARPKKVRIAAGLGARPVRRRRVLLGIGTGVVVAGGAGGAATLLTNAVGATNRGDFPNTNLGLGAAGLADSPLEAARIASAAKPTWPTPLGRDPELHLLRRATFGPTLVDVVAVKQMGLDAWLERQFNPVAIADPSADQIVATYPTITMSIAQIRATVKDNDGMAMTQLGHATLARQMWSSRQLYEVMVDFWANHLNVTNPGDGLWDTRSSYDKDVIRAHALGRFSDMLQASAQHPAMMKYLDNANSQKKSVNENYGRELLELHTVGLDAKYTEVDVRNSAYIMTGRTVNKTNEFTYDKNRHWVGPVKVMDFQHVNDKTTDGMALGNAYVSYLAMHPATAKRIAFKLSRRFVCDDPPQTLVDRLAQSYLDNGSAIVPVLRTLFSSVEFWMSTGLKTRRPLENVLATARIAGVAPGAKTADGMAGLYRMVENLGHAPLQWGPPDGYPDYADAWGSAHATLGTWNSHRSILSGALKGLNYAKPDTFVGLKPETVGAYLDTVSQRLIQQTMVPEHRSALLKFLGMAEDAGVKDVRLGGKIDSLVPLVFDSVYHALR